MNLTFVLATVVFVHILGAMSPGPAFVYAARLSAAVSRRAGVFSALGMGLGALFWASLVLLGFAVVLREAAWMYHVLKIVGGVYLIYLGVMIWRGAARPLSKDSAAFESARAGDLMACRGGFLTALSNPKMIIFFASVFFAVLPPDPPLWFNMATLAAVFTNEFLWYAVVALAFSTGSARRAYGRLKTWIDRLAGGVIAALGLRIIFSER